MKNWLIKPIIRAKNYDERQFTSCDIHNRYGIAKSGKDQGVVARGKQSVKRAGKRIIQLFITLYKASCSIYR